MSSIRNTFICVSLLFLGTGLQAQINEVGTLPDRLLVVRSLPTAGVKLYSTTSTSLTLYNLDLSTYNTITYPALPPGHSYFDVLYITESTFDTDPSTIELMMLTWDTNAVTGTRVIRDDGTILFDEPGLSFSGSTGYSELNAGPPLFTGEDEVTYMLLTSYPTNPPTESRLYELPGTLPCMDCSTENGMGLQGTGVITEEGELVLFPNPASDMIQVNYSFPTGASKGHLMVTDASGRLVANVPLDGSGQASMQLAGHANGHYTCNLIVDGRIARTRQFQLVR